MQDGHLEGERKHCRGLCAFALKFRTNRFVIRQKRQLTAHVRSHHEYEARSLRVPNYTPTSHNSGIYRIITI